MKGFLSIVTVLLIGLAVATCPTREYIPDPTPPEPKVETAPIECEECMVAGLYLSWDFQM